MNESARELVCGVCMCVKRGKRKIVCQCRKCNKSKFDSLDAMDDGMLFSVQCEIWTTLACLSLLLHLWHTFPYPYQKLMQINVKIPFNWHMMKTFVHVVQWVEQSYSFICIIIIIYMKECCGNAKIGILVFWEGIFVGFFFTCCYIKICFYLQLCLCT